jgi:nuclear pore complex protein Nup98-Nup96
MPPQTLVEQQNCTDISYEKGGEVPRAITNDNFEFIQFAEAVPLDALASRMEQRAWELAHILFDKAAEPPSTVSAFEGEQYLLRLRKERVSEFWKKLVRNDVQRHVARAESLEEKAFAYLTGGLIEEACNALIEGKNFHLATLVAQIGCDRKFRESMSTQLESWRTINNLAEFEDSIRAIYELLAGNTCICRGQAAAGTENVTSTFSFASRFDLDWRRSFGLRLWYGIDPDQDVADASMLYLQDLKDGSEEVKPVPWFTEQKITNGWQDDQAEIREDLLWSLLQLYSGDSFDLASAFAPESVSGNPLDARLSFQLVTLFQAKGFGVELRLETVDALIATYAADLSAAIEKQPSALTLAVWVLLHLSDTNARQLAIRSLLDQHASLLDDPPDGKIFASLRELRIPDNWMYLAKALYARAVLQDPVAEAQNLLEAGEWTQAHEVVCRTVGPLAVIENDADQLRELLGGLHDPVRRGNSYSHAWENGAAIYYDFVEMRDLETQKGQRWKELVAKLTRALQRVHTEGGFEHKELRERAALHIMGSAIADCIVESQGKEKAEALQTLVAEDEYLAKARALQQEYFTALTAAA